MVWISVFTSPLLCPSPSRLRTLVIGLSAFWVIQVMASRNPYSHLQAHIPSPRWTFFPGVSPLSSLQNPEDELLYSVGQAVDPHRHWDS